MTGVRLEPAYVAAEGTMTARARSGIEGETPAEFAARYTAMHPDHRILDTEADGTLVVDYDAIVDVAMSPVEGLDILEAAYIARQAGENVLRVDLERNVVVVRRSFDDRDRSI